MDIKLPKKSFYTIDDICKEWGINESTFWQYVVDMEILRVSFRGFTTLHNGHALLKITPSIVERMAKLAATGNITISIQGLLLDGFPITLGNYISLFENMEPFSHGSELSLLPLPKWLYLKFINVPMAENVFYPEKPNVRRPLRSITFEDFDRESYLLLTKKRDQSPHAIQEAMPAEISRDDYQNIQIYIFDPDKLSEHLVIPQEEKERFEAEYSNNPGLENEIEYNTSEISSEKKTRLTNWHGVVEQQLIDYIKEKGKHPNINNLLRSLYHSGKIKSAISNRIEFVFDDGNKQLKKTTVSKCLSRLKKTKK